jgi:hypothetical protein
MTAKREVGEDSESVLFDEDGAMYPARTGDSGSEKDNSVFLC